MGKKKSNNFTLKISAARAKRMEQFISSIEPSSVVTCNFTEFDDVVRNYSIVLTDEYKSAGAWVVSQKIQSVDTGISELFNDVYTLVFDDTVTNANVKSVRDAVLEMANELGENYPGFFDPKDHFGNFRRIALYVMMSEIIRQALGVSKSDSAASSASNNAVMAVDVNRLNKLVDAVATAIFNEATRLVSTAPIKISTKDEIIPTAKIMVSHNLTIRDINESEIGELLNKLKSPILEEAVKIISLAIGVIVNKPASSVYDKVVGMINRIFSNRDFIDLMGLSSDELKQFHQVLTSKISKTVTIDQVVTVMTDAIYNTEFAESVIDELTVAVVRKISSVNESELHIVIEPEFDRFCSDVGYKPEPTPKPTTPEPTPKPTPGSREDKIARRVSAQHFIPKTR